MTMQIKFFVDGVAQTAGSKIAMPIRSNGRRVGTQVMESGNRERKAIWRADMRYEANHVIALMEACHLFPLPVDVAVEAHFAFERRRPMTHFGRKKGQPYLKDAAPQFPTSRPDLLKVVRAAEDALTGVVWQDDSSIVTEYLTKRWSNVDRLTVTVTVISAGYGAVAAPTRDALLNL